MKIRNFFKFLVVIGAPLLLTACLLTPGKFTSNLDINRDGSFTFSYDGEVFMASMGSLYQASEAADYGEEPDFTDCYDDEGESRKCTAEETATRKADWEAERAAMAEENKQNAEMMKAMMGGLDPSDPEAVEMFTQRLLKQKGWNSVVHKGDGVFEISYKISGRMDRGFQFPVLEQTMGLAPFVVFIPRKDNSVRVDAPGFAVQEQSGMMGMAALTGMGESGSGENMPNIPMPDGVFTVTTDAEILTNNTEEGPETRGSKRVLSWKITPQTSAAPETLLKLD